MIYRNEKRKAAIWLLEQICLPPKAKLVRNDKQEINHFTYSKFKLADLIDICPYDKDTLRDAVDLLVINNHIDIWENFNNVYDPEIQAYRKGEIALREDYYQDEINEYKNNKIFQVSRWILPAISLLISLAVLGYTIYKDYTKKGEIEKIQKDILMLQHQAEQPTKVKTELYPTLTQPEKKVEPISGNHEKND